MTQKIPQEILDEAVSELSAESFPQWLIPKWKFFDGKTDKPVEIDVEEWETFCRLDEGGNYICPESFDVKTTYDGDEWFPVGSQLIFTKDVIDERALDIAKENYPDVYNELNNL